MIIGEQQFLTSNWNEFIHIEFLRNLMLKVPNFDMSVFDDIRSVDKVTITADENHENPITITYLNTEGQHKELHLAPEITARVIKLIKERVKFDLSGEGTDWDQVKINFYDRTSWGEDGPATITLKEGAEEIGLIHIPFIAATGTDHWEDGTLVAPKKVIFYNDNQIVVKSTDKTTIEYDFNIYETKEHAQSEYTRLEHLVENEATARENADKTLSDNLAQETADRTNADTDLTAKIDNEITDRTNGDAKTLADAKSYSDRRVSGEIESINELIKILSNELNTAQTINLTRIHGMQTEVFKCENEKWYKLSDTKANLLAVARYNSNYAAYAPFEQTNLLIRNAHAYVYLGTASFVDSDWTEIDRSLIDPSVVDKSGIYVKFNYKFVSEDSEELPTYQFAFVDNFNDKIRNLVVTGGYEMETTIGTIPGILKYQKILTSEALTGMVLCVYNNTFNENSQLENVTFELPILITGHDDPKMEM